MNPEHNTVRKDILDLIPMGTRAVLDVGCADAGIHAGLRQKGVTYYAGLDIIDTPEFIDVVKDRLDRYIICDLNKMSHFPLEQEEFDVIIFGDILEHINDPWTVLKLFVPHLKQNGKIIISIPNSLFHYRAFRKILTGTLNYEPSGLWDITHIRFFTKKMIESMVDSAGLEVDRYAPNYEYDPWIHERKPLIMEAMNTILQTICFGSEDASRVSMEHLDDLYVVQFMYVVKKKEVQL